MLDLQWLRMNANEVQQVAEQKGIEIDIAALLEMDVQRRELLQQVEVLRQQRNEQSKYVGKLIQTGEHVQAEQVKQQVRAMNERLSMLEEELEQVRMKLEKGMLYVPNIVSPDTPQGRSDADNVEVKRVGTPEAPTFKLRDHMELGELHDMIDIPRGVKTAGTRHYYLKGAGVLLHRAVQQLALDLLMQRGFTPLEVPLMARTAAMMNTGFFPTGQDQSYAIVDEDQWLVGTSEVPLVAYYSNEIVDVSEPIRLAAASTCFRSEVGSAGKDVHGLYRVHQFAKVEQVVICKADRALAELLHQEITAHAEEIVQLLELPYRMLAVCTGDMAQKTYKQFDIETWMPSRQAYGETHSSSNLLDFQARRSGIRYRDAEGNLQFAYTLNNTAVATPRILIPLLENHQDEDGGIHIPQALRPYMNGLAYLAPSQ
ncbi:serine--tRNA ligase [Paenibacillus sp. SC116]|uniref:serine--tRNA ligase n=1 Tax=Paenibacillus sp. SC116 TaxID=2968986 RepID=UPI00215AC267|nr:serine--tRNA ligase [Paenibacillus sp. SC116]MCR8844626.1 serine--tRNA ligase [Paenibacillus sp. SC116]